MSLDRPRLLIMTCPEQSGARKLPRAELPAIGIVEIPGGCSIQTDEWNLQTSRRNSIFSTREDSVLLPQLKGVNWALAGVNESTVESEKLKNSSLHAAVESSLARIAGGAAKASNFGKTIRALEEGDRARQEKAICPPAYPYELWGGVGWCSWSLVGVHSSIGRVGGGTWLISGS